MIEVRYAGAVVSRSAVVRDLDARGLFIGLAEPLPVGTEVTLGLGDDAISAKVASVSESQELTRAGMRVVLADPSSAELFRALADATPALPMSGSGSARVLTSLSASGSGSARVAAPTSSLASGPVMAPAAGSSPPVVESKPSPSPGPVPLGTGLPAPVATSASPAPPAVATNHSSTSNADAAAASDGADDVVDASGPIVGGSGAGAGGGPATGPGGGGAGSGGGGGGRRNRRNRRR